jgi:DNA invertase Pin-like site-specific DNA recombinase
VTIRRIAISYSRFSHPHQRDGDSLDRQKKAFKSFCKIHNLTPLAKRYEDCGRSGYSDAHRKKGELGQLIEAAKAGEFEPGTVIVAEAWDRLGRLRPDKQTELIAELLKTGMSIGVCRLNDIFTEEDFGSHKWTVLSTFIMLAYQESKQKGERVSSAWAGRRERAKEGVIFSRRVPAWLEVRNGKIVPIAEYVAIVQHIFALAANGYGKKRIIQTLVAEGIKPFGGGSHGEGGVKWASSYLEKILCDRRALGEYQPRKTDKTTDGELIPNYFPRVISDEQFNLARAGMGKRRKKVRGRDRKYVNVFRGLLKDADGDGFLLNNSASTDKPKLALVNAAGFAGRGKSVSIPYHVLETAILGQLREVTVESILPTPTTPTPCRVEVLRAKLKNIRADMASLQADLKETYSKALATVLRDKEQDEIRIAGELQDELAASARPTARAWEQLPSLVDALREHGDEARLKLRGVLRSVTDEIRLLLVRRHSWTLAAVQFFFVGGATRHYLVATQYAGFNRPGGWCCPPSPYDAVHDPAELDLRRPDHARLLESRLAAMDLDTLLAAMQAQSGLNGGSEAS